MRNLLGRDKTLKASEENFSKPQECSDSPHFLFWFALSLGWVTGSKSQAGFVQTESCS